MNIDLFPERLKKARQESAMSFRELAKRCGSSASHLCDLEGKSRNPTIGIVQRISEALGVPGEWLLGCDVELPSGDGFVSEDDVDFSVEVKISDADAQKLTVSLINEAISRGIVRKVHGGGGS